MRIEILPSASGNVLIEQCWTRAVHTFGTASIFERRARRHRAQIRLLNFLGIAVPVAVGAVVLSFGTNAAALPWMIGVAGVLGTLQLIATVWSVVAEWNTHLAYAQESSADNRRLASHFESLASTPPPDLANRIAVLQAENLARSNADVKQGLSTGEQHLGFRIGLARYRKKCGGCMSIADPQNPSDCPVCGRVNKNKRLFWRTL